MTKPRALTYYPYDILKTELTEFDICIQTDVWNAHYGLAYIDYRLTLNNKLFATFKLGLE